MNESPKQKIKFAVIAPIALLERYATLSRVHLVLAQHLKNNDYARFYYKMRERGDEIILDNGTYENHEPLDESTYWEAIKQFQPTVAALPDFLLQPARKTISASLRFLDKYADQAKCQWMFVPQSSPGDRSGLAWAVDSVVSDLRVGQYVGWIGLPRAIATRFENFRPTMIEAIRKSYPWLRIHCLGMANGDVAEMKACEEAGAYSIDSSAPVWRGLHGLSISKPEDRKFWDEQDWPFELDKTTLEIALNTRAEVEANLREVGIDA